MPAATNPHLAVTLALLIFVCEIIFFFIGFTTPLASIISASSLRSCPSLLRQFFAHSTAILRASTTMLAISVLANATVLLMLTCSMMCCKLPRLYLFIWFISAMLGVIAMEVVFGYCVKSYTLSKRAYSCSEEHKTVGQFLNSVSVLMIISSILLLCHVLLLFTVRIEPVPAPPALLAEEPLSVSKPCSNSTNSKMNQENESRHQLMQDQATQIQFLPKKRHSIFAWKKQQRNSALNPDEITIEINNQSGFRSSLRASETSNNNHHSNFDPQLS